MPHPTLRYAFEAELGLWARRLCLAVVGERRSFFIGFRQDGTVRRIYWMPPGSALDADRKTSLASAYSRWFLYSPYSDSPETYMEWLDLDRATVEIWLGASPEGGLLGELGGEGALKHWPGAWRVILP